MDGRKASSTLESNSNQVRYESMGNARRCTILSSSCFVSRLSLDRDWPHLVENNVSLTLLSLSSLSLSISLNLTCQKTIKEFHTYIIECESLKKNVLALNEIFLGYSYAGFGMPYLLPLLLLTSSPSILPFAVLSISLSLYLTPDLPSLPTFLN